MAKRNPIEDVPRRIYKETIKRIDKHLEASPRAVESGKRKIIKGNFNKFLELLLDSYEGIQNAKILYVNKLYEDVSEARGEAISYAVKTKQPVKFPTAVIIVGKDE